MKAVIVAPEFDYVTKHSSAWCDKIAPLFEEKVYLTDRPITRAEVEEALEQNPEAIFIFYNHGSEDALWGSRIESVVDLLNAGLLSGREVYTLACLSAKYLGREARRRKCRAYWGYEEEFTFTLDALDEFKASTNEGIKLRLKGLSWKECLKKTKQLMTTLANKLMAEGKLLASTCMEHNRDCLRCWNAETPPPICPLRALAVRLFGVVGYRIPRKYGIALLLFGGGLVGFIHDRICEWATLGYQLHGMDAGVVAIVLAFIIVSFDFVRWLRGGSFHLS